MTHKKKWLLFAPAGLALIGCGACLVQWAGQKKEHGSDWVLAGTVALGVLNAGVSLFGRGVAEVVLYELEEKELEESFDYNNVARF
ncbi:hypothetical protein [Hymenobacter canadensis]|uniref:Lipoprotein n=1 Tax=Hymenobacter canadensis TaxID=2999067 RepID=A0ABY7LIB7_9BACT|nr:hypothetical protein [Hymenobacter canadensis]WBA40204.1 hypothetical protein O3303_10200 [Hymenobacter canadensis]